MDTREQIINVLFNESETLDEGFVQRAASDLWAKAKQATAITAKQKAQANNYAQTIQAKNAADKSAGKAIRQAKSGKAGRKAYKEIMSTWTIKDANAAIEKAANTDDLETLIQGLEYAVCGINVLGAGANLKAGVATANADKSKEAVKNTKNDVKNNAINQVQQEKNDAVAQAENVSGNA